MGRLLIIVGILACLIGLVWIGQGTGYFQYPKRSFMINEMSWAYRGAVMFLIGVILVWRGRRRR